MIRSDSGRRTGFPYLAGVVGRVFYGLVLVAVGGLLTAGGVRLISLGGSVYYCAAGLMAVAAGSAAIVGRWRLASLIYLGLMAMSGAWGLWESGLNGWALAPRILSPAILGLPFLAVALASSWRAGRIGAILTIAAAAILMLSVAGQDRFQPLPEGASTAPAKASSASGDWPHFGNDRGGRRFSPLNEITSGNVDRLEVVWSKVIGPNLPSPGGKTQAVPLKIGDRLYTCTPFNDVLALNPDTGDVLWHFRSNPRAEGIFMAKCRGVAHYAVPEASGFCSDRIYTSTADSRLIALDSATGRMCPGFGEGGQVNLLTGLKMRAPGYYNPTSAPQVVRGKIVVNAGVADGQHVGEPSGVVRAYDAVTGKLAWAWDLGDPEDRAEPPPGEYYTSGTPNSWGPMSADEDLGLVYLPMGSATPDFWGGHRSEASHRYSNSVVALDAETGALRWSFQAVRRDVWDYDVSAQPVLFDLETSEGLAPALMQPSKTGDLFVLDRRTGAPLFPVVEQASPQSGAVEPMSPSQPRSLALPDLSGPRLGERQMWGITALDQMWCRIRFREMRYDGKMTPPGLTPAISDPGNIGGVNWGSAAIDPDRQVAVLLSTRVLGHVRMIPRSAPAAAGARADPLQLGVGLQAQEGTPYVTDRGFFTSPLKTPCQQPPYGMINVVDLRTGKMLWSRPLGSARDLGPMGLRSMAPFTIGTPTHGGVLTTAGRLAFASGAQDHAIRAFDTATGKLLFEADLAGSSWSTPMTYRGRDGRQFILVSHEVTQRGDGDYHGGLTAFALPRE